MSIRHDVTVVGVGRILEAVSPLRAHAECLDLQISGEKASLSRFLCKPVCMGG